MIIDIQIFKNKCGVYCIKNTINSKIYIGASVNIYKRLVSHKSCLNTRKVKQANTHITDDWHFYGSDKFVCSILEECDTSVLKEKELYYMLKHNSLDLEKGYNLRSDKNGKYIAHKTTVEKLRLSTTESMTKERRNKIGIFASEFWKNNLVKKITMAENVSKKSVKYNIHKLNEDNEILEVFNSVREVVLKNPTYKAHNIYSVCSGAKKRIYGYKWKKVVIIKKI